MDTTKYQSILLIGPPGAGKGTWGRILGMIPGFYHLSTGDMFRNLDTEGELGKQIMDIMRQGRLVPDNIVFSLWRQHLEKSILTGKFYPGRDCLVLDGIPRTATQAQTLHEFADVKTVIMLHCPDREILFERLRRRALNENRVDDASETVLEHRIEIYEKEIKKILARLRDSPVEKIDVSQSPISILSDISRAIERWLQPD